jgi:hypothetical protein
MLVTDADSKKFRDLNAGRISNLRITVNSNAEKSNALFSKAKNGLSDELRLMDTKGAHHDILVLCAQVLLPLQKLAEVATSLRKDIKKFEDFVDRQISSAAAADVAAEEAEGFNKKKRKAPDSELEEGDKLQVTTAQLYDQNLNRIGVAVGEVVSFLKEEKAGGRIYYKVQNSANKVGYINSLKVCKVLEPADSSCIPSKCVPSPQRVSPQVGSTADDGDVTSKRPRSEIS